MDIKNSKKTNKITVEKPTLASTHKQPPELAIPTNPPSAPSSKKRRFHLSRRTWIIIGASSCAVLIIVLVVVLFLTRHHFTKAVVPVVQKVKVTAPPKPILAPSPLTGLEVSPAVAANPVTAVIQENLYPNARPQSGLSSAGVVYEALVEGGITRYEAFYQEPFPADIGPVRSLRTFFAYWGREYNVPVVHAGGNIDAINLITPLGMKNIDGLANGSYFRRITTRAAPHNFYIYGPSLQKLVSDKGFATAPDFTAWPRKSDTKPSKTAPVAPTAATITVNFSGFDYQAKFTYNATTDNYTRYLAGVLDTDANGNTPIQPKNVVVMYEPFSLKLTTGNEETPVLGLIGTGKVQVFEDGNVTQGTWTKSSNTARTTFTDAAGKPIALNRGQTWVCVVPVGNSVVYQ